MLYIEVWVSAVIVTRRRNAGFIATTETQQRFRRAAKKRGLVYVSYPAMHCCRGYCTEWGIPAMVVLGQLPITQ